VEGANVIVDGQLRTVTDSLGYYRLDQVLNWFYLIKLAPMLIFEVSYSC